MKLRRSHWKFKLPTANATLGNKKEPPKIQASGDKCNFWKQEGATKSAEAVLGTTSSGIRKRKGSTHVIKGGWLFLWEIGVLTWPYHRLWNNHSEFNFTACVKVWCPISPEGYLVIIKFHLLIARSCLHQYYGHHSNSNSTSSECI